ncbi:hypothetical protein COLO4_20318 [Corchorus olitorius]|uniref:Uncharacterized protein n=1 Tax=Corchorus olitorius TaxID=93759 RepID=A0A1R3J0E7_9ROSI|nr:hypothetical protein COLO4_20318 [Corchorus olitorius]
METKLKLEKEIHVLDILWFLLLVEANGIFAA